MKKLIVISSDEFIRNFIRNGSLSEIESENTYYIASSRMKYLDELKSKKFFLASIDISDWSNKGFLNFIFPYLTFIYKSKSSSFDFRSERLLPSYGRNRIFNGLYSIFQKVLNKLFRRKKKRVSLHGPPIKQTIFHILAFLAAKIVGKAGIPLFFKLFAQNNNLEELILDLNPDIVIIPSSAADVLGNITTRICKLNKVPVIHIISGWDNLSSKIVYPYKPDFLCVWGPQSVEFARDIHAIPPKRVFTIGVPAFDNYFHLKKDKSKLIALKSPYDSEYVLFAGCAVAFDELTALQILEDTIEKEGYQNLKIVYRPHPWRQRRSCPDNFDPRNFKHVILDIQMEENYYQSKLSDSNIYFTRTFLPSLDYYPKLLNNARFVICPLSTMTLESLIFERSVLSVVYDDGIHITSPHNLLRYDHFNGIEYLEGITFCRNKKNLADSFKKVYEETRKQEKSKIMEQLRYYIYYNDESYAKRLKKVIDNLNLK